MPKMEIRKLQIKNFVNRHKQIIKLAEKQLYNPLAENYMTENKNAIATLYYMITELKHLIPCSCNSYWSGLVQNVDEQFEYVEKEMKSQKKLI